MLCTEWGKGAWELSVPWDPQSSPSDATVVCIMPSALLVGGRDSITAHWVSFLLSFLDGTTDISQGSKLMGWKEGNHPPRIFLLFILNTWSRYRTSRKCIGTIRCHYIFPPQVKTHHYFPLPGKKEKIPYLSIDRTTPVHLSYHQLVPTTRVFHQASSQSFMSTLPTSNVPHCVANRLLQNKNHTVI